MELFKKLAVKLVSVLIFNGALYALLNIVFYLVGLLYWQGLLNTLGLDYSFVRMDDYVFYITGGFASFNYSHEYIMIACLVLYVISFLLFMFSDFIYLVANKTNPKSDTKKIKLKTALFLLFLFTCLPFVICASSVSLVKNAYKKGVTFAQELIDNKTQQESKYLYEEKLIKLKNNETIKGKLIGCSKEYCIIYAQDKAFTIEKQTIASIMTIFNKKKDLII